MKERPIIFNDEMVRAILDGRKTQTRRVVKPQPKFMELQGARHFLLPKQSYWEPCGLNNWDRVSRSLCPYGKPGDRLWVREKWGVGTGSGQGPGSGPNISYYEGPPWSLLVPEQHLEFYAQKADRYGHGRWFPSIHMPRWASRITLEITKVRVDRLQDISETDALAEGITYAHLPDNGQDNNRARTWFRGLWESIHGAGSWSANPWVWVVEFGRVEVQP